MTVQVYTRSTCAPCQLVKRYFQLKGIHYDEINVDDDPASAREVIERSGRMMVPMTIIGDRVISGMNLALIADALMV